VESEVLRGAVWRGLSPSPLGKGLEWAFPQNGLIFDFKIVSFGAF